MEVLRKNILASLAAVPQRKMLDVSKLPCSVVATGLKSSKSNIGSVKPEFEAIQFYALNHLVAHLQGVYTPHETLRPDDANLVNDYLKCLIGQSRRMFTYLFLICTREARHAHSADAAWWKNVPNDSLVSFHKAILGKGESAAIQYFMDYPPNASLGQYQQMIRDSFYKLSWGGGYGGKPWGNIADCCLRFVLGESSAEVMVDTGFTLAHNNGPIFNKGMVYDHYDASDLRMILDVQRSGQIPEMVLNGESPESEYVGDALLATVKAFKERYPAAIGSYVDWYKVEELGSIGKYPKQKKAQASDKGAVAENPTTGKPEAHKGSFYVDPKLSLPIIIRAQKAA